MPPTSRRIFLYWVLLLVPTLAVGTGAIVLLRREQARLAERAAYADEARRAAVAARAALIVENLELFIGDVQAGLLDTLAAEPPQGLNAFLERWEESNPLVRTAFRAAPDGTLLRPDPRTVDEDTRGFVRRFGRQFGRQPPWSTPSVAQSGAQQKSEQPYVPDESAARQDVTKNVAQVQNARRDVQQLFKDTYAMSNAARPESVASTAAPSAAAIDERAAAMRRAEAERSARSAAVAPASPAAAARSRAAPSRGEPLSANIADADAPRVPPTVAPDRRGWVTATIEGRLHIFGWLQPGGRGDVRGAELDLAAVIGRLGALMPAELGADEGYALRDNHARVLHQAGAIPRGAQPAAHVPLAASLLPGWDVVGYVSSELPGAPNGAGFFGASVLLVGISVAAILVGGSLLLLQARRSEQEAVQKTSFVANVSHEFKTPLTTIRLYAELLEQGRVRDAGQGKEYLRTIGRETQRLARLVNNALDFSRLEQGRKKFAREPLDLTVEIARLLDAQAPRVAECGLHLTPVLPAAPVPVMTDRDALEQILLNVLDNACKYARDGGEVCVRLAAAAGSRGGAEVRIGDRGPGVPLEHRERIFEKFHRVDDALTAAKTGTGLGLSIARQLARGLGGDLRYAPRDGGGAEFILHLP